MDNKDTAILLHLISKPTASNKEIAETLDLSEATVSRRIKSLRNNEIYHGSQIVIDRAKLQLQVHSIFIIPQHPWKDNVKLLEYIFERYGYTAYQNRVFGKQNGLFIQVSLPIGQKSALDKFLHKLIDSNLIVKFELYTQTSNKLRYSMDINRYDIKTRRFDLDYSQIAEIMEKKYPSIILNQSDALERLNRPLIQLISNLFTNDATRSLAKIGENLGLSKQDVSRMKKEYGLDTWEYEVRFDRDKFGVFNQVLYVLNFDGDLIANLDKVFSEAYPFKTTIIPCDDHLLVWLHLPSVDVMQFTNILQQHFDHVDLYLLSRKPINYPPWEENLNMSGEWILDESRFSQIFDEDFSELITIQEFLQKYRSEEIIPLYDIKYPRKS